MNDKNPSFYTSILPVAPVNRVHTATLLIAIGLNLGGVSNAHAQVPEVKKVPQTRVEPSLQYTVQPQDKLIVLSNTLLNDPQAWTEVAQYNGLKNPNLIITGQKLNIPLRYLKTQPSGGQVVSASGDVSMGGQPVVIGSAIKEGSQFKIGSNSSAVIELGDGSRIKLLPNTVAEVITNREYAMRDASKSGSTNWFSGLMRLTGGALEAIAAKKANRATALRIETPTSTLGVRGTEFRVAFDDPAALSARTEVLEGMVRADNPLQAAGADLPMGTGAVVKPLEKNIKVVNLLPAPNLAGMASDVFQPLANLNLPALPGAFNYRVVIARDEQFNNIVRELKVPVGTPASLSGLANGSFYAQVRGIDGIGLEGFNSVKRIAIQDAPPPEPRDPWQPGGNQMIVLSLVSGRTILTWNESPGENTAGMRYAALVSQDAALKDAKVSADSLERRLDLGVLRPGTYFVRLRFTPAGGKVVESTLYQFTLSENWNQTVFNVLSALQLAEPSVK